MPYQPYDTGWIKSIYGGICLTWFLYSRGCLPHVTSVLCYNNIFIPFIEFLNKFYEFIGNIIIAFGSAVCYCESVLFNRFNYIDPIFNSLTMIQQLFSNINISCSPAPCSIECSKAQNLNRKALMLLLRSQASVQTPVYHLRFEQIEE